MQYTICPNCGYKLFKGGDGTVIELFCPKCREKLFREINHDKIITQRILTDKHEEEQ